MLSDRDWESVYGVINRTIGKKNESTIMSKVIKRDEIHKLVWVAELADQPIPLLAFDYEVKYYDTDGGGVVREKVAKVEPATPEIGDLVFIVMERGTRRLPRCVGKVQSRNYITTSLDDA
jgi:hypothetical protein